MLEIDTHQSDNLIIYMYLIFPILYLIILIWRRFWYVYSYDRINAARNQCTSVKKERKGLNIGFINAN